MFGNISLHVIILNLISTYVFYSMLFENYCHCKIMKYKREIKSFVCFNELGKTRCEVKQLLYYCEESYFVSLLIAK